MNQFVNISVKSESAAGLLEQERPSQEAPRSPRKRLSPDGQNIRKTSTYKTWVRMRKRCQNENSDSYKHYGGRGIEICQRWNDYENFLADLGERPKGMTLDRINTNGNYEPSNCRWASWQTQQNNRRNNRILEHNGRRETAANWARILGINPASISWRLFRGWTVKEAFFGRPSRRGQNKLDLTGKRFGRLIALSIQGSDRFGNCRWLCACDCGKEKVILRQSLLSGRTQSCGCKNFRK